MDDIVWVDLSLVCHTAGCENDGVVIPLAVPRDVGSIVCGPCGQSITDSVPVEIL